jgi:Putative metal-binding motif
MMMPGTPDAAMPGPMTGQPDAAGSSKALRILSEPISSVVVGETFRYRLRPSVPGATVEGVHLPDGAVLDATGNLTWTPTVEQGGAQIFSLKVTGGGETAVQEFKLSVGVPRPQRTGEIDPNDPVTTTLTVDAPLSPIRGAGVQIDPGSLVATEKLAISISTIENAPVPPQARISGISIQDLLPIELGPSGTAFRKPARVQLPATAELLKAGTPTVLTMDPDTGAWENVKVLAVDEVLKLVTAEIEHFSTYVVVPELSLLEAKLGKGGTGTPCAESLVVRAGLKQSPAALPADTINGYAGTATDFAGVVAALAPGQGLQTFIRAHAVNPATGKTEDGFILVAATKDAAGQFQVRIHSDRQAGPILSPAPLAATDPTLLDLLAGRKGHFIFSSLGTLSAGAEVTVELFFYLVDAADAAVAPVNPVDPVARETFSATMLTSDAPGQPGYDLDCDQTADGDDAEPGGDPVPRLKGDPASPVRLIVGQERTLTVAADLADVLFTFSGSAAGLGLMQSAPNQAVLRPTAAGFYQVRVLGVRGKGQGQLLWDVLVDEAAVMASNTPPVVQIAATHAVARVGEVVTLQAIGRDKEQLDLGYKWQASEAGVLSSEIGPRITFVASAPGDYKVTCVANDGLVDSAAASIVITVLAPMTNRPPGPPAVTPLSALVTHPAGEPVSVTLTANAVDPDGDEVSFEFAPDPSVSRAVSLTKVGNTAQVKTVIDGSFLFHVTAQDSKGATSPSTAVRIQILPPAAIEKTGTDADKDGYPAGADCNDGDAKIFPGSREICGDNIDQNCDGRDLPLDECDRDGDRYTTAGGDCDDQDPRRNPNMPERCDGIDNNCNNQIDEGFEVGKVCAAGMGGCRAEGKTKCSATFITVVCDAVIGAPKPETCDMIDNDCNGRVDDVAGAELGTVSSCGGCGVACPTPPSTIPACLNGGCVARCQAGFVDLDRNLANGCECAQSNKGVEICDGLDNDCNGIIDDAVTQVTYGATFVTQALGVCGGGTKVCRNGTWVDDKPARLPSPEVCDGLDNDCNGIVDDNFSFMTDISNCGGCGIVCPPGGRCDQGRCVGGTWGDGGAPPPPPPPGSGTRPSWPVRVVECGKTATGGPACVDVLNDALNCGACGKACDAGSVCYGGICTSKDKLPAGTTIPPVPPPGSACPTQPPPPGDAGAADSGYRGDAGPISPGMCTAPLTICKDQSGFEYCTDPNRDPRNCGGCGIACPVNMFCNLGKCSDASTMMCPPDSATCPLATGGVICARTQYDPMNCGACGKVCPSGSFCNMGQCQSMLPPPDGGGTGPTTCPVPLKPCEGPAGGTICIDPNYDRLNCGGCKIACAADQICMMGKCAPGGSFDGGAPPPMCFTPMLQCKVGTDLVACVDPRYDPRHCGACGIVCPQGQFCQEAKCVPAPDGGVMMCPAPLQICKDAAGNAICADFNKDPKNCGKCGGICAPNQICLAGVCAAP